MRGRVKDPSAIRKKIRAGGAAVASRDQAHIPAVHVHRVDLITLSPITRRLKDELFAVSREIGFRVLPTEGELFNVFKMFLLGHPQQLI
jgi:hypothetical protein